MFIILFYFIFNSGCLCSMSSYSLIYYKDNHLTLVLIHGTGTDTLSHSVTHSFLQVHHSRATSNVVYIYSIPFSWCVVNIEAVSSSINDSSIGSHIVSNSS